MTDNTVILWCHSLFINQEAECEKEKMDVAYQAQTNIADSSREFQMQKAAFDQEVNARKAESELSYELQVNLAFCHLFFVKILGLEIAFVSLVECDAQNEKLYIQGSYKHSHITNETCCYATVAIYSWVSCTYESMFACITQFQ